MCWDSCTVSTVYASQKYVITFAYLFVSVLPTKSNLHCNHRNESLSITQWGEKEHMSGLTKPHGIACLTHQTHYNFWTKAQLSSGDVGELTMHRRFVVCYTSLPDSISPECHRAAGDGAWWCCCHARSSHNINRPIWLEYRQLVIGWINWFPHFPISSRDIADVVMRHKWQIWHYCTLGRHSFAGNRKIWKISGIGA
jgi:hypothetical protein